MFVHKFLNNFLTRFTFFVFSYVLLLSGCSSLINNDFNEEMILIPEGLFTMGFAIDNENAWGDMDEEPVHKVNLPAYWIDKYEVTSSSFAVFINENKNEDHRFIEIKHAVTVRIEENVFIPRGAIHRIENHYKEQIKIIEVQTGDYLGEDDIERYEDLYGRKINPIQPKEK